MARFNLRPELGIEKFLDGLVGAAAEAGADPEKARPVLREVLARDMTQADLCGIFSNCQTVGFFDPFVKPDADE
jgi:hypothetical protein